MPKPSLTSKLSLNWSSQSIRLSPSLKLKLSLKPKLSLTYTSQSKRRDTTITLLRSPQAEWKTIATSWHYSGTTLRFSQSTVKSRFTNGGNAKITPVLLRLFLPGVRDTSEQDSFFHYLKALTHLTNSLLLLSFSVPVFVYFWEYTFFGGGLL